MVPVLARMAVIIKSQHKTSIMTGNYEMYYACGLMYRLAGIEPPDYGPPAGLWEKTTAALEQYAPADEREAVVLKMIRLYQPDETMDEQTEELFRMGAKENAPWKG